MLPAGYEQTLRASLGLYNGPDDIDRLIGALRELR
jgi:selenocysteine lyase/cysteine desulfurase